MCRLRTGPTGGPSPAPLDRRAEPTISGDAARWRRLHPANRTHPSRSYGCAAQNGTYALWRGAGDRGGSLDAGTFAIGQRTLEETGSKCDGEKRKNNHADEKHSNAL